MADEYKLIERLGEVINRKFRDITPGAQAPRDSKEIISLDKNVGAAYVLDKQEMVTHLYLEKLVISKLPDLLVDFRHLTGLSLYGAVIDDYSLLERLHSLEALDLSHNDKLTDISQLRKLSNLAYLDLKGNSLTDITPLKDLKNLTIIDLSENRIEDLSFIEAPGVLEKVLHLNLCQNKIKHLPRAILKTGRDISMDHTAKSEATGTRSPGIHLHGNLIETPPMEIILRGTPAVKAYYDFSERGNVIPLNEVRVLLVGDGGSGKTSLVKRLLKEGFSEHEDQTHGIAIKHKFVHGKKGNIKANLWDFGGQEIMHATHQFFLSKRSLYILALDGRKDPRTDYWLKLIRSFGGDSPILVVLNKIDQSPGFDINRKRLKEKYPMIKGFCRVSCKTCEGIEEFSSHLEKALKHVEIVDTRWPSAWFDIKSHLENAGRDFISYEEYWHICNSHHVTTRPDQETLVGFFHDLGIVLNFKDFDLEDTHVLNPQWVTGAVYKIITAPALAESKGVLPLMKLEEILVPQEKYPREKYKYIIALMKKFELCFSIDDERILVPDLLVVEEVEFDFDYDSALKFIFEYDFLPKSVLPRLMVRMHRDIDKNVLWRSGARMANDDFRSEAAVKIDNDEKRIYIFVTGEQRREYFSVIRYTLQEINDNFKKLIVKELVPLPDTPSQTVEYGYLLRLEKEGIKFYFPPDSEKKYSVFDLLGTIEKKEKEDETVQALKLNKMFQTEKKIKDTANKR